MVNLEVFSLKQLNNFKALLDAYASKGITDCIEINKSITEILNKSYKRVGKEKEYAEEKGIIMNSQPSPNKTVCPSCEKAILKPVLNQDNIKIIGCSVCRYSEIIK